MQPHIALFTLMLSWGGYLVLPSWEHLFLRWGQYVSARRNSPLHDVRPPWQHGDMIPQQCTQLDYQKYVQGDDILTTCASGDS